MLYYRRRERQARDLADRNPDPSAKRVHLELARMYAERLAEPPGA